MSIFSLKVKGSLALKDALGVDEIALDLSGIKGLVAFAGKNGQGKSTVLEMLQPFARLASRKGALASHFFGKDAFKELWFPFQGHQYHSLIKIDSDSGRTEGFLWKDGADKSMTNGKISEYSKVIAELLGSPDLFFASTFCAQNARKLNELTTGKLQELFSEILRLDKLVGYSETSKQCKNVLTNIAEKLKSEMAVLHEYAAYYDEDAQRLEEAKGFKEELEQGIEEIKGILITAEDTLLVARDSARDNDIAVAAVKNLQSNLDQIIDSVDKDTRQMETELAAIRKEYRRLDLETIDNDSLLANEGEIRSAAEEVKGISDRLKVGKKALAPLEKDYRDATKQLYDKQREASASLAKHKGLISESETGIGMIKHKIKTSDNAISDLKGIDPDCDSTICAFIIRANNAQDGRNELTKRLKEHETALSSVEKDNLAIQQDFEDSIDVYSKTETTLKIKKDQLKTSMDILEIELIKLTSIANDLPKVLVAESKKKMAMEQRSQVADKGVTAKEYWEERIEQEKNQQLQAVAALAEATVAANKTKSNDVADAIAAVNSLHDQENAAHKKIADTQTKISLIEERLSNKSKARTELKGKAAKMAALTKEINEWTYLQNACGKKGIQALEIDAMAPKIAANANTILLKTFGASFTIKFKTLDDEGKEILTIVVIKENGKEVKLDNISGGQKVWILQALRLGVTLINQEKSEVSFPIGFADELDGPLDVDNAVDFVQMYRAFMEAGGFELFLFISHKIECQTLAEHVVRFGDGKIVID